MDLNGEWILTGEDEQGRPLRLSASVPGCVHTDLKRHGLLPDLYYRDNSKFCQWIEKKDFTYEKTFTLEALEENAYLEFDGLDTYCDIFVNGIKAGHSEDMFVSVAVPVDGLLKQGENTVSVKFYSPIEWVKDFPEYKGAFTRERMNTRRLQCTYSWDWVDRFVTMGIYKDVRLVFRKPNSIADVYVVTEHLFESEAQLFVKVNVRDFADVGETLSYSVLDPDGKEVFAKKRVMWTDRIDEYIDVPSARLWYPNGYGEQPLYTLRLSTDHDEKAVRFGIRTLQILQLEDTPGSPDAEKAAWLKNTEHDKNADFNEKPACFVTVVNGVRIMCKGGDWVPCEPFPSEETYEKFKRLLKLAKLAHVNMIRVWGGGLFEQDDFYDLCDEMGILVSQDFLMACGTYPEEKEWFIEALKKETAAAALRLRNHACLAWWSGDNENAVRGHENINTYPGFRAATFGIEPILRELDPRRYFLPSSPYGGNVYCSASRGTTHNTYFLGPFFRYVREEDFSDWRAYNDEYLARFDAEEPAIGMPFVSSLKKFLTEEDIFGEDTSMSEFHTKNNPGLGQITLYDYVDRMTRKLFGEYTNGEDRVWKMQMLQCEKVRISMELFRRNKWFSSGILYWMLEDCWPAANGWSLIDYYAMPKPAYYVFSRSAKDVIASIEKKDGEYLVHICNDSLKEKRGSGTLYMYDFENDTVLHEKRFSFVAPANSSVCAFTEATQAYDEKLSDHAILLCDITGDGIADRAFLLGKRYSDLTLSRCEPVIIAENEDSVTVTVDAFQPFVMIDVPYLLEENCFPMKKGEIKKINKVKGDIK